MKKINHFIRGEVPGKRCPDVTKLGICFSCLTKDLFCNKQACSLPANIPSAGTGSNNALQNRFKISYLQVVQHQVNGIFVSGKETVSQLGDQPGFDGGRWIDDFTSLVYLRSASKILRMLVSLLSIVFTKASTRCSLIHLLISSYISP